MARIAFKDKSFGEDVFSGGACKDESCIRLAEMRSRIGHAVRMYLAEVLARMGHTVRMCFAEVLARIGHMRGGFV